MKKLLLSAVALCVLFTACKDDDTNPEPTPQPTVTKLLLNIVADRGDTTGFVYNTSNEIVKYEEYYAGNGYHSWALPEYKNGRMVTFLSSTAGYDNVKKTRELVYDNAGKLLKVYRFDSSEGYDSLTYDGNGRLATIYVFVSSPAGALNEWKWVLTWDDKGNVIKRDYVSLTDGKPTGDTMKATYTYDDKVNYAKRPELSAVTPDQVAYYLSANNILTEKVINGPYTFVTDNVYTYDEEHYPVTMKTTYSWNGEVINYQIRYTKQ